MKKTYVKFSNGSTTMLIDMYDSVRQAEAQENGFYAVIDEEDGVPVTVDSSELVSNNDKNKADMLRAIAAKAAKKAKGI